MLIVFHNTADAQRKLDLKKERNPFAGKVNAKGKWTAWRKPPNPFYQVASPGKPPILPVYI